MSPGAAVRLSGVYMKPFLPTSTMWVVPEDEEEAEEVSVGAGAVLVEVELEPDQPPPPPPPPHCASVRLASGRQKRRREDKEGLNIVASGTWDLQ